MEFAVDMDDHDLLAVFDVHYSMGSNILAILSEE
jgi:hypothetical protein